VLFSVGRVRVRDRARDRVRVRGRAIDRVRDRDRDRDRVRDRDRGEKITLSPSVVKLLSVHL
jgi:hypothetical protein